TRFFDADLRCDSDYCVERETVFRNRVYCSRGAYSSVRVVFSVTLPTGSPSGVACGYRRSCCVGGGAGRDFLRSVEPEIVERFLTIMISVRLTIRNANNMNKAIKS